MSWADVYRDYAVKCGQANELHLMTKTGMGWATAATSTNFGKQLCQTFFEVLQSNVCLNVDVGWVDSPTDWQFEQYCYVPKQCRDLNGGDEIEDMQVSWKICNQGLDNMTRHMT